MNTIHTYIPTSLTSLGHKMKNDFFGLNVSTSLGAMGRKKIWWWVTCGSRTACLDMLMVESTYTKNSYHYTFWIV